VGEKSVAGSKPGAGEKSVAGYKLSSGGNSVASSKPVSSEKSVASSKPSAGEKSAASETPDAGERETVEKLPSSVVSGGKKDIISQNTQTNKQLPLLQSKACRKTPLVKIIFVFTQLILSP
jgi:hypothetical protein